MKLKQFIARMTTRLCEAVTSPGDFGLPFRVIPRRAPANVLGEFKPFVWLQLVNRVFNFRDAHHQKAYELWRDKQGGSCACEAPLTEMMAVLNQKPSQRIETPV